MEEIRLIPTAEFCEHYHVEASFISSLEDYGLIELEVVEEKKFISPDLVHELEKFIHLHYDLDINMEGIDAISHLLKRVARLRQEMDSLRSRLRIYE